MRKAYVDYRVSTMDGARRFYVMAQSPNGKWHALRDTFPSENGARALADYLGFEVITKEESFSLC